MDRKAYLQKWKTTREEWEASKKIGDLWYENELKLYKTLEREKDAFIDEKRRYEVLIVQKRGNINKFSKKIEDWAKNNPQLLFSLQSEDILLADSQQNGPVASPKDSSNFVKEWKSWYQTIAEEQQKINGLIEAQNQVQQKIDLLEKKSALLRKIPQQRAQKCSILKILTALSIGAMFLKTWPDDKDASWKQSGTIQDIKRAIPYLRSTVEWQNPTATDRWVQNMCAALCLIYEGQLYDDQALKILDRAKKYINDPSIEFLSGLATDLKRMPEEKNKLKYDLGEVMWEMSKQ